MMESFVEGEWEVSSSFVPDLPLLEKSTTDLRAQLGAHRTMGTCQ